MARRNNSNPHYRLGSRTSEPVLQIAQAPEPQTPDARELKIKCPKCLESHRFDAFKVKSRGGIKCPTCGFWLHVRLFPDLSRYVRGLGVTPSGNDTLDIADATADLLRSLNLDALYDVTSIHLEQIGPEAMSKGFRKAFGGQEFNSHNLRNFLMERYWERNPGMQRMNLGNILRAAQKRRSELNIEGQ